MKKIIVLLPVLMLAFSAQAQPLFAEDFEAYEDTAEMVDLNPLWDTAGAGITISTSQAHGGSKSLEVSNTNQTARGHWLPMTASALAPVVLSYWQYDTMDHALYARNGISVAGYSGGAWGSGSLENYVYAGPYHASGFTLYNYRVVYGGPGWQAGLVSRIVGWHNFVYIFDGSEVTCTIDGVETTKEGFKTCTEPPSGWSCMRIGSPAGSSYTTEYFDDLYFDAARVDDWRLR